MKIKSWTNVFTALLLWSFPAEAVAEASKNGNNLLEQCETSSSLAVIACHIYLHAVQDVLIDNTVGGYSVCIPENTDIDQSVNIVVGWLIQHADARHQPASDVVAHALWEAYPCR